MKLSRSAKCLRTGMHFLAIALTAASAYFVVASPASAAQIFANNTIWFRADVGVLNPSSLPATNGNAVATWEDQSVSGFDVTQSSNDKRPVYLAAGPNGLPTVQFDNGGGATMTDVLHNTASNAVAGGSNRTVLVAGQAGATSPGGTLFTFRRTTPVSTSSQMLYSGLFYVYSDGVTVSEDIPNPANATLTEIRSPFVSIHKTVVGSQMGVDLNGTQRTVSGGVVTTDSGTTGFSVGSRDDQPLGTFDWNGQISEVLVYSRVLNTAENVIATNYLSSKYGTTLTGSDRYNGDTLGNGNYDFEVFGIGSDNATTNLSAAGTVSTGTAGTGLSLAELGGSLAPGDYVLAGQDSSNPNSTVTTDLVGTGAMSRLGRIWFVEKTGLVDATVTFNLDDLGLAASATTTYSLLYRIGTAGNFTKLGLLPSISGDDVSFAVLNGSLLNGFYTLAISVPEPSTLALLGLGVVGMTVKTRRRRRTA